MRSYFSAFINRETEQALINIITSFLTHVQPGGIEYQLFVFVRKNRKLGRIYVKKNVGGKTTRKAYYSKNNWELEMKHAKYHIISQLLNIHRNARATGVILDHININRMLASHSVLTID